MCHGMLRRVGFPQKDGAGRELIRRRPARRDEKRNMRPYLCDVECQREAGHMTWHMDVGEEEMDCGGMQLQVTESFFRMASFNHLESREIWLTVRLAMAHQPRAGISLGVSASRP